MTEHMFMLGNWGPGPTFWSPWKCLCGAGDTGADAEGAETQYELHTAGHWPAYIEPTPGCEAFEWKGKTLWAKP